MKPKLVIDPIKVAIIGLTLIGILAGLSARAQERSCEDARDDVMSQYGQALNLVGQLNKKLRDEQAKVAELQKKLATFEQKPAQEKK
jgi:hypothetical protein